jgi:predicted DNA-binding WGR domain protein
VTERYFIHPENNRFWSCRLEGATVHTRHGLVGGALVDASETFLGKNQGKKNELSPAEDAASRMDYSASKKIREGYQEFSKKGNEFYPISGAIATNEIDFDNLSENFCCYKPYSEVVGPLEKKMQAGKVWYGIKRNGAAFFIAKGPTGIVQMYSRRMFKQHDKEKNTKFTWNDRFPNIVKTAAQVMPNNSIICGELVVPKVGMGYQDDFKKIQKITKSLTPEAIDLQKDPAFTVAFYVWDTLFWDGKCSAAEEKVSVRYQRIKMNFSNFQAFIPIHCFQSAFFKDSKAAIEYAKTNKLEGFVVVDPDGIYGEDAYNFKGKPDRPKKFCGKLKPEYEADVIVEWDPDNKIGNYSTKDKFGTGKPGIKSVAMFQYRPDGTKVYLSDLGVGLSDEMRIKYADKSLFPAVWKVIYTDRRFMGLGDDTNAMDFARFDSIRWTVKDGGDKPPKECVDDRI